MRVFRIIKKLYFFGSKKKQFSLLHFLLGFILLLTFFSYFTFFIENIIGIEEVPRTSRTILFFFGVVLSVLGGYTQATRRIWESGDEWYNNRCCHGITQFFVLILLYAIAVAILE